jgi:hypothetical protein
VDLLVWIRASSRDAVMTGYAQALADLNATRVTGSLESAGPVMLEWLATTRQRWLVVLEDLADGRGLTGCGRPAQTAG